MTRLDSSAKEYHGLRSAVPPYFPNRPFSEFAVRQVAHLYHDRIQVRQKVPLRQRAGEEGRKVGRRADGGGNGSLPVVEADAGGAVRVRGVDCGRPPCGTAVLWRWPTAELSSTLLPRRPVRCKVIQATKTPAPFAQKTTSGEATSIDPIPMRSIFPRVL